MPGQRKRLPDKAIEFVKAAEQWAEEARDKSRQAKEAAQRGESRLAAQLSTEAEAASAQVKYFTLRARDPQEH